MIKRVITPEHRARIESSLGMTIGEWLRQPWVNELIAEEVAIRLSPVIGWRVANNTIGRWRRAASGKCPEHRGGRRREKETSEVDSGRWNEILSARWR
jgi:hypothetical protein